MTIPKYSIIVPAFNAEQYIRPCVDSILNQICIDWELLLIDDGSTDNTPFLIDEYASNDVRVHSFHKPNGGVSSARNMGLEKANGEYIVFVDADDTISPPPFD